MIDSNDYSRERIQKDMLSRVPKNLDTREGSVIQTAIGPAAWYLEGLYMELEQVQNNAFADTAADKSLELICAAHDISRKKAVAAVREGLFNIKIPQGAAFKTINGAESLVFTAGNYLRESEDAYVYEMICNTEGAGGNSYSGSILPITAIKGLASATIGTILTSGTDEELDDALRERLFQRIRFPSTSGNKYDYYNWAMECENVGATKVFPLANGPGTVKVVIADRGMTAAAPELIRKVADHIGGLRPIGADVTVVSAVERAVNVSSKVHLSNGVNLGTVQNAFHEALADYLHSNAFDLTYVSLARIGSLLLGIPGIADYDELQLNGVADNIRLEQEEIAVAGAVTLEVVI